MYNTPKRPALTVSPATRVALTRLLAQRHTPPPPDFENHPSVRLYEAGGRVQQNVNARGGWLAVLRAKFGPHDPKP